MKKIEIKLPKLLPVYFIAAYFLTFAVVFIYHTTLDTADGSIKHYQTYNPPTRYYAYRCQLTYIEQNENIASPDYRESEYYDARPWKYHVVYAGENAKHRTRMESLWWQVTNFHMWDILLLTPFVMIAGLLLRFTVIRLRRRVSISFQ